MPRWLGTGAVAAAAVVVVGGGAAIANPPDDDATGIRYGPGIRKGML